MRRRSTEIKIFDISLLDLFASTMGAFILVTALLFPYYPNTGEAKAQLEALRADQQRLLQQLAEKQNHSDLQQRALAACGTERDQLLARPQPDPQQDLKLCRDQLKKKFVLVLMSWATTDDVDLHVIDPLGREYYFKGRSFRGSAAKLEEDNIRGPGNEIWLHPQAEPGTYKIYYDYYRQRTAAVTVRGSILTPDGKTPLPERELRFEDQKPLVAELLVDGNGHIAVKTVF